MEQRPLRLGDIVDDYCPRERRITNHAIVAIVENAIRQTRCSTCDAEHVYKEARVPRRRQADSAVTEKPGLAPKPATGEPDPEPAEPAAEVTVDEATAPLAAAVAGPSPAIEPAVMQASAEVPDKEAADVVESEPGASEPADEPHDAWQSHRRLIRARLPRVEGEEPPARPIPEFTMHQRQTRGSQAFRGQGNGPARGGNGNGNGQSRGGPRHGRSGASGDGNGNGNGQPAGGGRSRRGRHRGPKRPR